MKVFANDKSKVVKLAKFVTDRVENNVGKKENTGNTLFSNGFFSRAVITRECVGNGFKGGYLDFSHLTKFKNIHNHLNLYEKTIQINSN